MIEGESIWLLEELSAASTISGIQMNVSEVRDVPVVAGRARNRGAGLSAVLCEGWRRAGGVHGAERPAKDARHVLPKVVEVGEVVMRRARRARPGEDEVAGQGSDPSIYASVYMLSLCSCWTLRGLFPLILMRRSAILSV